MARGRVRGTIYRVMDIRAMVWDARVIAPNDALDVTVIVRVTYHSIEALCGDLFDETESVYPARPC